METMINTAETFEKLLEPLGPALSPELARALSKLTIDESIQNTMDTLADKNTEGTLTEKERSEYHSLVSATSLLSVLKARAKASLAQPHGQRI